MNPQRYMRILAARARHESPPRVDVARQVILSLRSMQDSPAEVRQGPMMWVAVLSTAAAVPAAVFALVVYYAAADPIMEIARAISWAIQ
jgi:hypothetical protein